jgi:hypothetical protein
MLLDDALVRLEITGDWRLLYLVAGDLRRRSRCPD